jgi:hypothetical protein
VALGVALLAGSGAGVASGFAARIAVRGAGAFATGDCTAPDAVVAPVDEAAARVGTSVAALPAGIGAGAVGDAGVAPSVRAGVCTAVAVAAARVAVAVAVAVGMTAVAAARPAGAGAGVAAVTKSGAHRAPTQMTASVIGTR